MTNHEIMEIAEFAMRQALVDPGKPGSERQRIRWEKHMLAGRLYHEAADLIAAETGRDPRAEREWVAHRDGLAEGGR